MCEVSRIGDIVAGMGRLRLFLTIFVRNWLKLQAPLSFSPARVLQLFPFFFDLYPHNAYYLFLSINEVYNDAYCISKQTGFFSRR